MQRILSAETKALIDSLHKKVPFWESTSKHQETLLEQIGRTGDAAAIPDIASYLLNRNRTVARAAATAISILMETLLPIEFAWLDQWMRERSPYRWSYPSAWAEMAPAQVGWLQLLGDPSALGLASFHFSGYVRAEALRKLADIHDGTELPFLLLRLNDWVKPVREFARHFLDTRLVAAYAPFFVVNIALVQRLRLARREEHDRTLKVIEELLACDAAAMNAGLNSPDKSTRRFCYELRFERTGPDQESVIERAFSDADPTVRELAAKSLSSIRDSSRLELFITTAMEDKSPAVRGKALQLLVGNLPERAQPWLRQALLDPDGSVRGYAQYHSRGLGTDLHEFYLCALHTGEGDHFAAVSGLGEVGGAPDADLVLSYMSDNIPRIRRAAIRALARFDAERFSVLFLSCLSDRSASVSREAMKALYKGLHMVAGKDIWSAFSTSKNFKVRRNALFLISRLSKWESIAYLVLAVASDDDDTRKLAETYLNRWFIKSNSSFIKPTMEQVERLNSALEKAGKRMEGSRRGKIAQDLRCV